MANVLGTSADYLIGKTDDNAPNIYWVDADIEPERLSIIDIYGKSDSKTKERLSSYFLKLLTNK